jgi:hypothetical protein
MPIDAGHYATAFLLTVLLEVAVALLLGFRKRSELLCVVAVNVFSHPLLVYLLWAIDSLRLRPIGVIETLLLEAGVVVVEWRLLRFALPRRPTLRLLLLSLAMNGVSYLSGILLASSGI